MLHCCQATCGSIFIWKNVFQNIPAHLYLQTLYFKQ